MDTSVTPTVLIWVFTKWHMRSVSKTLFGTKNITLLTRSCSHSLINSQSTSVVIPAPWQRVLSALTPARIHMNSLAYQLKTFLNGPLRLNKVFPFCMICCRGCLTRTPQVCMLPEKSHPDLT